MLSAFANTSEVASTGLGIVIFIFVLFIIGLSLAGFIFWLLMLVHAARSDIKDKALWILIIVLGQLIGAIVYLFVVKLDFDKAQKAKATRGSKPKG